MGDGTSEATGDTTTALGCNTAGSSSFTTGTCVHADTSSVIETNGEAIRAVSIVRRSGGRNKVLITLVFPLKLEEIVVATGIAIRVGPAHGGASFINRATALALVKKHAHRFIDRVFAMPQHAHGFTFVLNLFGKFFSGSVYLDTVMPRQTRDVGWFGLDVIVAAAVAGAFGAVVGVFRCHDANFKLFNGDSKGLSRSRPNDLIK